MCLLQHSSRPASLSVTLLRVPGAFGLLKKNEQCEQSDKFMHNFWKWVWRRRRWGRSTMCDSGGLESTFGKINHGWLTRWTWQDVWPVGAGAADSQRISTLSRFRIPDHTRGNTHVIPVASLHYPDICPDSFFRLYCRSANINLKTKTIGHNSDPTRVCFVSAQRWNDVSVYTWRKTESTTNNKADLDTHFVVGDARPRCCYCSMC